MKISCDFDAALDSPSERHESVCSMLMCVFTERFVGLECIVETT